MAVDSGKLKILVCRKIFAQKPEATISTTLTRFLNGAQDTFSFEDIGEIRALSHHGAALSADTFEPKSDIFDPMNFYVCISATKCSPEFLVVKNHVVVLSTFSFSPSSGVNYKHFLAYMTGLGLLKMFAPPLEYHGDHPECPFSWGVEAKDLPAFFARSKLCSRCEQTIQRYDQEVGADLLLIDGARELLSALANDIGGLPADAESGRACTNPPPEPEDTIDSTAMQLLYYGTGARDFEIFDQFMPDEELRTLMMNVRALLKARKLNDAIMTLEAFPFRIFSGTNSFQDEFTVLLARVPLNIYEKLRTSDLLGELCEGATQLAGVINEVTSCNIRFVAVNLSLTKPGSWDVFICHASEDKDSVARPIFRHLDSVGIRCWFDEGEILWGDSITQQMNEGLSNCRFVIVVLSESMLAKNYAVKEMNAALNREIRSGQTRVLPLMVGTEDEIRRITDKLALQDGKKYLVWQNDAEAIEAALRALLKRASQ